MPRAYPPLRRGLDGLQRARSAERIDVGRRQAAVERSLRGALAQLGDQLASACDGIARGHDHRCRHDLLHSGCGSRPSVAQGWAITGFSRTPSLSISMRTVEPAFRHRGGSITKPTPAGVPVAMMVPGSKRERRRQVGDQLPAVGDHLLGRRVLAQVAVDPGADAEIVRIADLVGADQPRARSGRACPTTCPWSWSASLAASRAPTRR